MRTGYLPSPTGHICRVPHSLLNQSLPHGTLEAPAERATAGEALSLSHKESAASDPRAFTTRDEAEWITVDTRRYALRDIRSRPNTLYYGDNLDVLRQHIEDKSVDLVYLDPPFKSDARYNVLFRTTQGSPSPAQIHAFDDTWSWTVESEETYQELLRNRATPSSVQVFVNAMFQVLGKSDMMAYLVMMAPRLVELRRVLKDTGSIYLHCDPTTDHYLKLLMDQVFGVANFLNEVVWCYGLGGSSPRYWPRKHDTLLWYSRSENKHFFTPDLVPATSNRMKGDLKKAPDFWDIPTINNMAHERLGYPTQKPLALLERVVRSSSPPDGIVLDPFCGCGTAVDAAQGLGRRWIGIDIAYIAVDLIRNRLIGRYGREILTQFRMLGIPQDIDGARALAISNKIDFERWAVSLVNGQPTPASNDQGVDGWVYFARTYREPLEVGKAVVSVKGGDQINPSMVRDLTGILSKRGAQMGLLITVAHPTRGMKQKADAQGTYTHDATGTTYPRIQIVTINDLLTGKAPQMPSPLPPYLQATCAPQSEAVSLF